MPGAKDRKWMRSSLAAILVTVGSLAGLGCTQMPEEAPRVRIPWLVSPTDPLTTSVDRDARRVKSVSTVAPGDSSDERTVADGSDASGARRAGDSRRARDSRRAGAAGTRPAAARVPAKDGRGDAGLRHVNQMPGQGQRANNGNAMARSARRSHDRNRGGQTRGEIHDVAVGRPAPSPDGESPALDRPGSSVDSGSLDDRAVGSPEAGVGEMDRSESSAPERTVVRGGSSGDDAVEMTRFVRPEEPDRSPRRSAAPSDFRTVFSDPAVFSSEPPRPFLSWTRCGHGRF